MNQEQRIEYFMSEIARLSNQVVDLQDERDALAAQVEALRREIQSAADWFSAYWPELNKAQCDRIRQMDSVAKATPQQHLANLRAWAVADAVNAHPEKVAYIQIEAQTRSKGFHCDIWLSSSDLIRYADSIRQEGK